MDNQTITASIVPEDERMDFLPTHFGKDFMKGENLVYAYADRLIEDYKGAYWIFYKLSNGSFFLAPRAETLKISHADNYFEGTLSGEAAGIVVTLFAMNHLMSISKHDVDALVDAYYALKDYGCEHPEASLILSAID